MGQNDQFPLPNLSAGYGFSKQTIAERHEYEQDAPMKPLRYRSLALTQRLTG